MALTINAISGYSGGGRQMIEAYEAKQAPPFELYALGFEHKHLPEIAAFARLSAAPLFVPSVGNFRQGMLVSIPLHLDALPGGPRRRIWKARSPAITRAQGMCALFPRRKPRGWTRPR